MSVASPFELYVDESGNAGGNYSDADQPFYVTAGILVRHDHAAEARRAFQQARGKSLGEVKGAELLRRKTGPSRVVTLIRALAPHCVPFFVIMERRFCLVGKVVDVFLDPAHQPNVAWLPTSEIKQRKEITTLLYRTVSAETLELFASAYRAPTKEGFASFLNVLIEELARGRRRKLARAFRGALAAVDTIVAEETYGDELGEHGQWSSVNLPAFLHLVRYADQLLDGSGPFTIVHDNAEQYEKLFRFYTRALSAPGYPGAYVRLHDGTRLRPVLRNCAGFRSADSRTEILIQGADVLAAAINKMARQSLADIGDPKNLARLRDLQELARLTLPALIYDDEEDRPPLAGAFMDEDKLGHLLVRLLYADRIGVAE